MQTKNYKMQTANNIKSKLVSGGIHWNDISVSIVSFTVSYEIQFLRTKERLQIVLYHSCKGMKFNSNGQKKCYK